MEERERHEQHQSWERTNHRTSEMRERAKRYPGNRRDTAVCRRNEERVANFARQPGKSVLITSGVRKTSVRTNDGD